jgi:hypothetical protein
MQECKGNTYELALYNRPVASGTLDRTDTMKAGESAFLVVISRFGSGSSKGLGDCNSCNSLLLEEKLFSELDVITKPR